MCPIDFSGTKFHLIRSNSKILSDLQRKKRKETKVLELKYLVEHCCLFLSCCFLRQLLVLCTWIINLTIFQSRGTLLQTSLFTSYLFSQLFSQVGQYYSCCPDEALSPTANLLMPQSHIVQVCLLSSSTVPFRLQVVPIGYLPHALALYVPAALSVFVALVVFS